MSHPYNALLPYETREAPSAIVHARDVILHAATVDETLIDHAALRRACNRVRTLIDLKHALLPADHHALCTALFDLGTRPRFQLGLQANLLNLLTRLLTKPPKPVRGGPGGDSASAAHDPLALPWRPLYTLLCELHLHGIEPGTAADPVSGRGGRPRLSTCAAGVETLHRRALVAAARACRRHLSPGAARAVWAHCAPQLAPGCATACSEAFQALGTLHLLLPTECSADAAELFDAVVPAALRMWCAVDNCPECGPRAHPVLPSRVTPTCPASTARPHRTASHTSMPASHASMFCRHRKA